MKNLDYLEVLNYIMPQITNTTIRCGEDYINFDGYMARLMRAQEQQKKLNTTRCLKVLFPYEDDIIREEYWEYAHGDRKGLVDPTTITQYRTELQKLLNSKINMNAGSAVLAVRKGLNSQGHKYTAYHQKANHPICKGCYVLHDKQEASPDITILDQPMWFLGDIFNLMYQKNPLSITVNRREPASTKLATSLSVVFDLDSSLSQNIRTALNSACPLYESLPELNSVVTPALFTKQAVKEAEQSIK